MVRHWLLMFKDPQGGNFLMTFSVNQWRAYLAPMQVNTFV